MNVQRMIATHPSISGKPDAALIRCIEACLACSQSCVSCADACLAEFSVSELVQCIRLNLDCADVCGTTGMIATRRTGSNPQLLRELLDVCEVACASCAHECERHAQVHEHCRICAQACRSCEQACRAAAAEFRATSN